MEYSIAQKLGMLIRYCKDDKEALSKYNDWLSDYEQCNKMLNDITLRLSKDEQQALVRKIEVINIKVNLDFDNKFKQNIEEGK